MIVMESLEWRMRIDRISGKIHQILRVALRKVDVGIYMMNEMYLERFSVKSWFESTRYRANKTELQIISEEKSLYTKWISLYIRDDINKLREGVQI